MIFRKIKIKKKKSSNTFLIKEFSPRRRITEFAKDYRDECKKYRKLELAKQTPY